MIIDSGVTILTASNKPPTSKIANAKNEIAEYFETDVVTSDWEEGHTRQNTE